MRIRPFITQVAILICIGTGEYTTTFIAQHVGAGRAERIGAGRRHKTTPFTVQARPQFEYRSVPA